MKLLTFSAIAVITIFSITGCTTPQYSITCEEDVDIPNLDTDAYAVFDTDIQNIADNSSLCAGEGPLLENRFSPYKGGSLSVDLVVEHYSALQCPHCASFAAYVDDMFIREPEIEQRVRFYFHHYMFTNYEHYHMAAFAASQESHEKFWQLHDYLFATTGITYDYQTLRDVAAYEIQLDMNMYDQYTVTSNTLGQQAYAFLDWEKKNANANCIKGTPSVYLCGELVYDWRELEELILAYLHPEN